jgi:choline dehydrogenase-like flavoprotein
MIIDIDQVQDGHEFRADLAVVGAGQAGIVTALEAARRGLDVVVVETGSKDYDPGLQSLTEAATWDRELHAPLSIAVRRQLGGTSVIWGGRCVPYDPIDFQPRPNVPDAHWPVTYEDLQPYFARTCEWMKCGRPVFDLRDVPHLSPELVPGLIDGHVLTTNLERWSLPTNFGKVYYKELRRSPTVRVLSGLTCVAIESLPGSQTADRLACRTPGGRSVTVKAQHFVVAAGGLQSTRLLMNSEAPAGGQLGNHSGHLGRWYMAHLEGMIADIEFSTPPRATSFRYERDVDGAYVRRRLTFTPEFIVQEQLPNIAGWLASPELPDARHGNAQLSLTYLALMSPIGGLFAPDAQRLSLSGTRVPGAPYGVSERSSRRAHVMNVVRNPVETAKFVSDFGVKRVVARGRKAPGFFVYSPTNRYPFQYHGEHLPSWDSKVTLSRSVDALGMRQLDVDIRFSDADFDGVVRAHEHWDAHLRKVGVGRLRFRQDDPRAEVRARSGGGFHQVGTTRMASSPVDGVVDPDLRVHGVHNVFVASSSTFVTSGQANSTFMVVALAVRLVDHLSGLRGR